MPRMQHDSWVLKARNHVLLLGLDGISSCCSEPVHRVTANCHIRQRYAIGRDTPVALISSIYCRYTCAGLGGRYPAAVIASQERDTALGGQQY
jgi:hypothetical protein